MPDPEARTEPPSCSSIVLALRRPLRLREDRASTADEGAPVAPWGVQLAGDFSKDRALAAFSHARDRYARVLGDAQPMVIGTLLRSRGTRAFYRVRVPAASRNEANTLCNRIRASGGACVVLRS